MSQTGSVVLVVVLAGCATPHPQPAPSNEPVTLQGPWTGFLELPGQKLGVDLRFTTDVPMHGTMSVPAQGLAGLPFQKIDVTGHAVVLEAVLPSSQTVTFEGQLQGDAFDGQFTQGPAHLPFHFKRGERQAQAPKVRANEVYTEEFVTVTNGAVALAGTLTLPRGVAHPPIAIFITGSGPQDRDETVFDFPIFAQVSDLLARRGVASLRMDDRGQGRSTDTFKGSTTADFASDIEAAVAFVRGRNQFGSVGLLGHSEGGIIAPLVASRDPKIAFLILLAPPTVGFEQVIIEQKALIGRAEGEPVDPAVEALDRRLFAALRDGTIDSLKLEPPPNGMPAEAFQRAITQMAQPWFQWLTRYDPAPALSAIHCPTLALFGDLDLQVPPSTNAAPLSALASRAPVTVTRLPGLNHLFQAAKTGAPSEYGGLPKALDSTFVAALGGWAETHLAR
jgi:uncharacterized protein